MPAVSGVVKDVGGSFVSRMVRVYRRDTGAYVGQTLSNASTGAWSVTTADTSEHFAIRHDTESGDQYWNQTVLAMHMDDTGLTDRKGHTITISGNATRSATQSKFGGYSAYFDGTGDWLSTASSSDFAIISGDFTVDFHAYYASSSGNQAMIEFYADSNNRWNISLASGALIFYSLVGGTGSIKITTTAPSNNAWHYVALNKTGSTFTLYADGSSVGTSTTTSYHTTNSAVYVGSGGSGSNYAGYIDDLRVTKGVGRFPSGLSVPTSAFEEGVSGGTENALIYDRLIPV